MVDDGMKLMLQVCDFFLLWLFTGLDKQVFKRKSVNIFLPINFNICFGCSKEPSQGDDSYEIHNICFGREIRKCCWFCYTLLTTRNT